MKIWRPGEGESGEGISQVGVVDAGLREAEQGSRQDTEKT